VNFANLAAVNFENPLKGSFVEYSVVFHVTNRTLTKPEGAAPFVDF
jgi:hypothetical protein